MLKNPAAIAHRWWLALFYCLLLQMTALCKGADLAPLPPEKQGAFPIQIPEYHDIEQLLLLSNRWVIVVSLNIKEVLAKVDELSGGKFYPFVEKWEKSLEQPADKWDWSARKAYETLYRQYAAEARTQAGEFELDKASHYTLNSDNDEAYAQGAHPSRVTRALVSLGKNRIPGEFLVHYAQYSYLEFPTPMHSGKSYTISLKSGKSVSFTFDELSLVSRAIKVNQVGYMPDSRFKYAYLGAYLQEFGPLDCGHAKEFSVVSVATGEAVFKGQVTLQSKNPHVAAKPGSGENPAEKGLLTGEETYQIDLSQLKEEGDFFISIPGIGRSWTFHHGCDAYGEPFYVSTRGLYHQRCGISIGLPFTAWPRIKCHTDPVYESQAIPFYTNIERPAGYDNFDVIGATIDLGKGNKNATGGWHDAADWDRNIQHYINVFDLLNAFELAPEKFYDDQLYLPDSGDGIPDILSEAEYGLSVWRKSMDAQFGVAGLVETWTHPPIIDPLVKYAYSRRTRWSSLIFAAAAAQFAQLVKPFHPYLSDEWRQLALKAYEFGSDSSHSLGSVTIDAARDRGKGEKYTLQWTETNSDNLPYYIHASLRLFLLTGEKSYIEPIPDLLEKAPRPYAWPFSLRDFSPWIYIGLFSNQVKEHIPLTLIHQWRSYYLQSADEILTTGQGQPYHQTWPLYQNYWMGWGAMTMTNQSRCLLIAHHLSGDQKYKDAAILNLDYMLGANPMGMSWTTGLGFTYPIDIQHAVSENDGIADPVPGITIYGNTEGMFYDLTSMVWESPIAGGGSKKFLKQENWKIPLLRQWSCHPHVNTPQCEFTIHETMSSMAFTSAMLLCRHWMPSKTLKERLPREPQFLFGHWYLP